MMNKDRIVYEDEIEWLFEALFAREKMLVQLGKRPSLPIEYLYSQGFLYDFMMYLKYGTPVAL